MLEDNLKAAVRFFEERGWERYAERGNEPAKEIVKLFAECRDHYFTFRVMLREPYFGPVDRLQQGDPHYMTPGLVWIVGDYEFMGAYYFREAHIAPIFPLLKSFLLAARADLRKARAGELAPIKPGQDGPEPYKSLPDYLHEG